MAQVAMEGSIGGLVGASEEGSELESEEKREGIPIGRGYDLEREREGE